MNQTPIRSWKKVYQGDLIYIINEFKETVSRPAVIVLSGEMGAGKTTFCQNFAPQAQIQSPTYSIVAEEKNMVYADFYRLEKAEDVVHLELELYAEEKEYLFIEWGATHLATLYKILGDHWKYYEVKIAVNEMSDDTASASRDYHLYEISELY